MTPETVLMWSAAVILAALALAALVLLGAVIWFAVAKTIWLHLRNRPFDRLTPEQLREVRKYVRELQAENNRRIIREREQEES